jgi:hypothetical protein
MASGFINDSNQLQAEMYKVIITMDGGSGAYYPTADGDDNGGVTPYASDYFAVGSLPTTLVKGKARARGNMRFRNIVNRLTGLTDCQIRDITITEANADAQATSLQFTALFERPAFIPVTGTAIDGSTAITTTAIAIKNAIAHGIRDTSTGLMRVYDPTLPGDTEQNISVTATGMTATQTFGSVSVALIDESTLFD